MEHTHIAKDGTVYTHTHEEAHEHGHSHSHPHHHENTKAVLNRMNRAIGHMEAVKTMIEDGRDCSEVLIQIAAVRSAINNSTFSYTAVSTCLYRQRLPISVTALFIFFPYYK